MEYQEDVNLTLFLPAFIRQNEDAKTFDPSVKSHLWKRLIQHLSTSEKPLPDNHFEALKVLKILSREKRELSNLVTEESISLLLKYGLQPSLGGSQIEALSCLSNLLLQVDHASEICSQKDVLKSLFEDLEAEYKGCPERKSSLLLLLRIGVIITILKPPARSIILQECRGNEMLLSFYEFFLLEECSTESLVETSKFMYNLWAATPGSLTAVYEKGASVLKRTLSLYETHEEKEKVMSHSINLLSALPSPYYKHLLEVSSDEEETFGGESMDVPRACLNYLLSQLDEPEYKLEECISPVLMFLCQLSREKRNVRKYLRNTILPPLKNVNTRPEIGNEPRNKLCKLLTSPSTSIEALSSEFLFILCKEQVDRMVKYTGFGNAAGLLARKGLLCGKGAQGDYSDEDSETEEYSSNSHKINPVIGCIEKSHPSPFEGMSDEQKEYEAMKLVGIIDKLNNQGIIRPAMPGSDGNVVPMEHILQMTEGIEVTPKDEDSQ